MSGFYRKDLTVWATLFLIFASPAEAFDGGVDPEGFASRTEESRPSVSDRSILSTFSRNYDRAFREGASDPRLFFSFYYQENIPVRTLSPELLNEAERRAEARILARQAVSFALKETIQDVNLIYNIKEYGQSMTRADLNVREGRMNFSGPSLDRAGRKQEPARHETLRSSFTLINNADFGLSLRTVFMGALKSNVTYFLAGEDILGASLSRELPRHVDLKLEYRTAFDSRRVFANVTFPFGP